jgi:hypothetical protein
MFINWAKILPVIISIVIIITVAILREYSKPFAAIAATMPINIPLGMWIIVAGEENYSEALTEFSRALIINFVPTIFFTIVAWQMAKAGYGLIPTIASGYLVWGIGILAIFGLRAWLHF